MAAIDRDDRSDDLLLFICIATGAVVGFSVTGGAAVGTTVGAAAGMALVALHHRMTREGVPR
jgi:uncharacterized membrane protein